MNAQAALAAAHSALQRGDLQSCYQAAVGVLANSPNDPEANYLAGLALLRASHAKEGLPLLQRAHAAAPNDLRIQIALGESGFHLGDPKSAKAWFSKVVSADPSSRQALTGLAIAHRMLNELDEAIDTGNKVLTQAPDDRQAIEVVLTALQESGRSEEAAALMRSSLARNPGDPTLQQLSIFPYLYADPDPAPLAAILRNLGSKLAQACPPLWKTFDNPRDPSRKLRIGYISREFHNRWAPRFIGPLIDFRDSERFDVFCYYQTVTPSERDAKKSSNATWRDTTGMDDAATARLIRQDAIDILVDLGGWTFGSRLATFSNHPAPVQVAYLGFPATTGLPAMGYRIVDSITDPPGAEAFATEELIRMPGCFLCPQPNIAPPVSPPPCTTGAPFTFGSFNSMTKITTPVLTLWAGLLQAHPNSRLFIKNQSLGREPTQARIRAKLESLGIPPSRVILRGETPSESDHLASYSQIDIALDPFPYNGTTTTFDALWMGVPVITLPGTSHVSRVTASLLTAAGLTDFIATSEEDYISRCLALASNHAQLTARRATQRDQVAKSPLCDGPAFVRALESRYRDLWTRWCQGPHPAGILK
jgi:predicted O-linked N-acetylglucosamine transferase (SPINDLY family)